MADMPPIKITERLTDLNTYKKYAVYLVITILSALIVFGGIGLYRKFFPKPATTSVGEVQAGGIVNITNKNGRARFIIPFVEGGAEARDDQKIGAYIRAGLRLEW